MDTKELYQQILNEHNITPNHKEEMADSTISLQGINPSCGDNITLNLKVENGVITNGSFTGSGCAISQASVDMMLDLVIGKEKAEALELSENFMSMIKGTATEDQIESLDEAASLQDISKMPARVKCAVLGWRTMKECLDTDSATGNCTNPACCPSN